MKHSRLALAALATALVTLVTLGLAAEEPARQRVLVLTNGATLVGRIEAGEAHYEVRTESGASLIPNSRVLKLCDSPEEAYAILKQRANGKEPRDGLRLARWCVKHGLTEQARQEAEAVLKVLPTNLEAQRLAGTRPASTEEGVPRGEAVSLPKEASLPAESQPYDSETLQSFAQRVQPLLLNSCGTGGCHGGNKGLGFELRRPASTGLLQPNLTRQNLVQTLKLIDRNDSPNSLLLRKALESHGGAAKPPLAHKDVPAYETLESWVVKTAPPKGAQPLSSEIAAVATSAAASQPEKLEANPVARPRLPSALEEEFASLPAATPQTEGAKPQAAGKAPPQDPFDPVQFNEIYHPRKR